MILSVYCFFILFVHVTRLFNTQMFYF